VDTYVSTASATLIADSDHAARERTRGLVGARQIVEQHGGTLE
jgi:hypothetical protein